MYEDPCRRSYSRPNTHACVRLSVCFGSVEHPPFVNTCIGGIVGPCRKSAEMDSALTPILPMCVPVYVCMHAPFTRIQHEYIHVCGHVSTHHPYAGL